MLLNSGTAFGRILAGLFVHAGVGVDIFFGLSGYLICTLLLEEKRSTGRIGLPSFYVRRAFRIIPPILIYLSVLLFLESIGWIGGFQPLEMQSVVFFFRNYIASGTWYTGHFWSLAVEEHFYLFAPMLLAFLSWRASFRAVLALAAVCALVRWIEVTFWQIPGGLLEFRTESRLDGLMYGAALAHCLHNEKLRSIFRRYLTLPHVLFLAIVALLVLAEFSSMPFRRTVVAFTLPMLIGYTVLHPGGRIGRFLECRILRWLGGLSYSIYIWQMLFFVHGIREMPVLQSFPWAFAATAACAFASYRWIERPMIAAGHRIARGIRADRTLFLPMTAARTRALVRSVYKAVSR